MFHCALCDLWKCMHTVTSNNVLALMWTMACPGKCTCLSFALSSNIFCFIFLKMFHFSCDRCKIKQSKICIMAKSWKWEWVKGENGERENAATIWNLILVYGVEKLLKFQLWIHFNKIFSVSSVKWEIWTKLLQIKKEVSIQAMIVAASGYFAFRWENIFKIVTFECWIVLHVLNANSYTPIWIVIDTRTYGNR